MTIFCLKLSLNVKDLNDLYVKALNDLKVKDLNDLTVKDLNVNLNVNYFPPHHPSTYDPFPVPQTR